MPLPCCTNYYSNCLTLTVGCYLYTDSNLTTPAPNGYYSDGTDCFTVSGGLGEITAVQNCNATTTTTTTTSTTSTTTTACAPATVAVNNDTTTGGLGITSVTVNGNNVSYVSGNNFTIDATEAGTFETTDIGTGLTVVICYTAHTGTKHINLTDCESPANSFCCPSTGTLDPSGGCCTFTGVTVNCGCTLTITANDGACE